MFGAEKLSDGRYAITEVYPYRQKTFHIKEKLKSFGARWNPDNRRWENIDEKFLKDIPGGVTRLVKVRIAPWSCSDKPTDIYVHQSDIKNNQVSMLNMGDDHEWVNVEEIYGEIPK